MAENKQKDWIKVLEDFFKQLPKLPVGVREFLVKLSAPLSLAFGILGVLSGVHEVSIYSDTSFLFLVMGAIMIASSVLAIMAYQKLRERKYRGWEFLFWGQALNALYAIIVFSIGPIVGVFIGLYLLFQIKEYYK